MKNKTTQNKTNAEIGMEKQRNALLVQRRLSNVLSQEKKKLEDEGYDVPSISLSVQGDTRLNWKPEKYFNKSYKNYLDEIRFNHGLSMTEVGIIYTLSFYIGYEDNLLSKPSGEPLLKKDLCEVLSLGHNGIDKYMMDLVDKGVLAKVKIKRSVNYYLDPRISYQGNRIDKTLLTMFKISI